MEEEKTIRMNDLKNKIILLNEKITNLQSSNKLTENKLQKIGQDIQNIQIPEKKILQSINKIQNNILLLQQL